LIRKLSDKLVERLVPKTSAKACVGPTAGFFKPCYCIDGTCSWLSRWCDICGGITACGRCEWIEGNCCA
jgi:hypothetical protein